MPEAKDVGPWRGLLTVQCADGIERALCWVGSESSAQYLAEKYTANGKYTGARAWLCIGSYGSCKTEKAPPVSEIPDDEPEAPVKAPAPAVTLNMWGIE